MRLQTCVVIFLVFLQDENEIADMCTNFMGFCQEENEIADMCIHLFVFSGGE